MAESIVSRGIELSRKYPNPLPSNGREDCVAESWRGGCENEEDETRV